LHKIVRLLKEDVQLAFPGLSKFAISFFSGWLAQPVNRGGAFMHNPMSGDKRRFISLFPSKEDNVREMPMRFQEKAG